MQLIFKEIPFLSYSVPSNRYAKLMKKEDFVLDRRNLIYFNLYVIICSAEVHDIILACISLDESVKVTKFVTVSGQRL
jgi:hypothetical protein